MQRGIIIFNLKDNRKLKLCWILLAVIFFIFSNNIEAQISPGDLTTAHSKLEGISNCTNCHELGEKATNSKCLNCHKEIQNLIDSNTGFHSSKKVKGKECASCHSEHNGRNFRIVNIDENKFEHASTGFILTGKHLKTECKKCHQSKFIKDPDLKKRKTTYLGLSTNCISCHEDVHQNTLENKCGNCHNTESFKQAALFNHDTALFKLTGKHIQIDCVKCHKIEKLNGKKFQVFKGLIFNRCTSCHKDVHKGRFGSNCESCHNTSGFKNITTSSFNHNKTTFPLHGKHISVKCSDCHGSNLASRPKHKFCTDCHKDYHKGQFTKNKVLQDCSKCHDVYGFSPSTFTIENHSTTKFTLSGSHLAVSCNSCHHKTKEWNFTFKSEKCIGCHQNVHGNEISKNFLGNNACENCHLADSWTKINFDHSKTSFKLEGKHRSLACRNCHMYINSENKIGYKFSSLKSGCESCHNDIHMGQFKVSGKTDCTTCHLYENWNPVKFDHEKTKFSLKGGHSKLKCIQCHKPEINNGIAFIKYKLEEFKCSNCHS